MAFHLDVGTAVALAAGLAMLALAAALLVQDFASRVHRALALFLVLRGLLEASIAFTEDVVDLAGRLRVYLLIAVPFAVLWFAFVYRSRYSGRPLSTRGYLLGGLAILAAALLVEGLYLADHGLYAAPSGPDDVDTGPLLTFAYLPFLAYILLAFMLVLDARARPLSRRTPLLLAAFGLSVEPLFYALFRVADSLLDAAAGHAVSGGLELAEVTAYAGVLVMAAALLAVLPAAHRRTFAAGWALPAASALGVAVVVATAPSVVTGVRLLQFFVGIWSLVFPVLMAYALARHHLFDAEVKVRFAIRGTTLATLFLAVFFVVSQLAQNFLSTRGGLLVGGTVTGLVLFAINPLQRWADGLANRAVPAGPGGLSLQARRRLYLEQLEIAWGDGRLTPKERLLFARLQERLGIGADEAARLETQVVSRLRPGKSAAA